MAKATIATLKSFLKKNDGKIYVYNSSSFDGMFDMVQDNPGATWRLSPHKYNPDDKNYLGHKHWIYCVGRGGDIVTPYCKDGFTGFEVYNCCGSFVVAIKET